jgi:hypothetical protein
VKDVKERRSTMLRMSNHMSLVLIIGIMLLTCGFTAGCTALGDGVLPGRLEGSRMDSARTALLYEQKAELALAEAARYEQEAAAIQSIEDPKGFRREALTTAAKERRHEADEMQRMYASHQTQAQIMTGQLQRP